MHAHAAPSRRSPWAGLDALVLEEIEALRAPPPLPRAPAEPAFASDEAFLMSALRYLSGHEDPAGLVARLSAGFQLAAAAEAESEAGSEAAPAPVETAAAAPADEAGEADEADEADGAQEEDRP